MPHIPSNAFDVVLDKGTLDAILCGTAQSDQTANTLLECHRYSLIQQIYTWVLYPLRALLPSLRRAHLVLGDVLLAGSDAPCAASTTKLLHSMVPAMITLNHHSIIMIWSVKISSNHSKPWWSSRSALL